ncbi:unnamed protein product [Darwinula stevensoni]|uniref:Uncharacterized protein n=1 Tax=Darwinula stevensoni TaxID=69355 RepID=A0A7R9FNZ0_9CRUS|nr:unnamed protein product [Darwinula stevensoni]CAG0896995.1 unnamed protein product [Darwinula stevensoni]
MEVDKVLAKYTEELECVDIDEILDGLWNEGILKGFERTERKKERKFLFDYKDVLMDGASPLLRKGRKNSTEAFSLPLERLFYLRPLLENGKELDVGIGKSREISIRIKRLTEEEIPKEQVNPFNHTTKTPTIESGRNAQDAPASSRDVTDDAAVIGSDAPPDSHPSQPQHLDIAFQRAERHWGPPDMKRTIKSFAQSPLHAHGDCCGVVVMSHGDQSDKSYVVYSVDHAPLQVEWIIGNFSNEDAPELQNKPKLFFFQACRGQEQFLKSESGMETDSFQVDCHSASFQSDIFVANSSIPDFVSYRNVDRGSWFIESICDVFAKNAHNLDLQSMMTLVHERLSKYEGERGEKQSAEYWVRGNFKKLYFNPGIVAANP